MFIFSSNFPVTIQNKKFIFFKLNPKVVSSTIKCYFYSFQKKKQFRV